MQDFAFTPIGVIRSPFNERAQAPRQASVARGATGTIELEAGRGFEDGLEGLASWDYAWVLFVFHKNIAQGRGWRPKVLPPRATSKVGVFATRSPHRPNPIGLSAVRIERIEGRVVHVRELDLLDGTPVLDIKPYVPYADAHPEARSGWLEVCDPRVAWSVRFMPAAAAQLAWLEQRGVMLGPSIESALSIGPQPHAYRRIRPRAGGFCLALKAWRVDFSVDASEEVAPRALCVHAVRSGYRPRELATDATLSLHRAFVAAFGA